MKAVFLIIVTESFLWSYSLSVVVVVVKKPI